MASPAVRTRPAAASSKPSVRGKAEAIATGHKDSIRAYTRYTYDYDFLATHKEGKPMLSGLLQSNLIYWISRKTVGDEKRPEWARISITQLAQLCGGVERKSVATALADLLKRQIIAAPVREGCAANTPKMYKLCPENWRKAKPYTPEVDAELLTLAKQVEAGWADSEIDVEEDDIEMRRLTRVEVAPGKRSKPQPVAMPVKGAEPFMVRVVYHSEFDEPMAFRARSGKNGRLQVTACRPASNVVWGAEGAEEKAKACSRPQPHGAQASEENTELARYRVYLNATMLDLWETAKDERFIQAVFGAADGAPLEALHNQVAIKFKRGQGETTFRTEARKHQPGLLINLASDAARAFKLRQQTEKERTDQMPPVEASKPAEPLDPNRRWDRIRRELQKRLPLVSYENWFAYTWQIDETAELMTVVLNADQDTVEFLMQEYAPLIAEICNAIHEPPAIQWRAGR